MFVRRCHRSVAAAFGLAVILLAAYAVQVQSETLQQEPQPYIYYFPIIGNQQMVTLRGTVTNNNAAAAGETVLMMVSRNGGTTYTELGRTTTNGSGVYELYLPVQNTSDRFYAAYKNTTNDTKLWSFNCAVQTYTTTDRTCNFNVRDVALLAPGPGESIFFPYTFRWRTRSTTTDSYAITIYNDDPDRTLRARSDFVGYTDRATVASAPGGSSTGTRYYWSMRVQTPYGEGDAYWLNAVYYNDLNSPQPNLLSAPEWVEEAGEAGAERRVR